MAKHSKQGSRPARSTAPTGWLVSDLTPEQSEGWRTQILGRTLPPTYATPQLRTPPMSTPGPPSMCARIESFAWQSEISSAQSIDDPRSHLNHPCLRSRPWFEIPGCTGRGNPCRTADQRATARQTRTPGHLRHPFRSGEVRTCASPPFRSWRGMRRRVAVPRLSRDGVPMPVSRRGARPPYVARPPTGCGVARAGRRHPGPHDCGVQ